MATWKNGDVLVDVTVLHTSIPGEAGYDEAKKGQQTTVQFADGSLKAVDPKDIDPKGKAPAPAAPAEPMPTPRPDTSAFGPTGIAPAAAPAPKPAPKHVAPAAKPVPAKSVGFKK